MVIFFCAEQSYQLRESLIGKASNYKNYVLIEATPPWESKEFESKYVPINLKWLTKEINSKYEQFNAQFLLIYNENLKDNNYTEVLFFSQKEGCCSGYTKQEFHISDINDVALLLKEYFAGMDVNNHCVDTQTRDILICTHGSHDQCCAKYGNVFYREALATISNLALDRVRIWQASHIGGHRFAPTAIDFPDGRYYGRLDQNSFKSILTRSGDIQCFKNVYRGWGILPCPAQFLERELILMHGWDWFNYQVATQIVKQNEDESYNCVEIHCKAPDGAQYGYKADVVIDESKTLYLKGSCTSTKEYKFTEYTRKNFVEIY